jgi:sortase A
MSTMSNRRYLPALLIAGGALLLFLGVREVLGSLLGQRVAAREFEAARTESADRSQTAPRIRRGDPVAKMIIPRLSTELYVVEGDHEDQLRRGPGHLKGTAMPGQGGNCVIAGHRDTHFRMLKDIHKGDDIILETQDGRYLYRVKSMHVVSPNDTAPLKPTRGPELNLITCFPFYYVGSAPKRFVVEAQLAASVSAAANAVVE